MPSAKYSFAASCQVDEGKTATAQRVFTRRRDGRCLSANGSAVSSTTSGTTASAPARGPTTARAASTCPAADGAQWLAPEYWDRCVHVRGMPSAARSVDWRNWRSRGSRAVAPHLASADAYAATLLGLCAKVGPNERRVDCRAVGRPVGCPRLPALASSGKRWLAIRFVRRGTPPPLTAPITVTGRAGRFAQSSSKLGSAASRSRSALSTVPSAHSEKKKMSGKAGITVGERANARSVTASRTRAHAATGDAVQPQVIARRQERVAP